MATTVEIHLACATEETMALLKTRTERCNESTISTHGLRKILARSLGVNRYQAYLLVNQIVVKLLEKGVLEYWVSVGRGDVYKIDPIRLRESEMTVVTL